MITVEFKRRVVEALKKQRVNYNSDFKMSVALGISKSQFSQIKKSVRKGILSDAKWIKIAYILDVPLDGKSAWHIAKTPVFEYIMDQLTACQQHSMSGLLCDHADIGKTFTAKHYARTHKYAVYIDCAQVKTRQRFIREIAREFGVGHSGIYAQVYGDLVFYLQSIPTPLVILDEAGDLEYPAFLELKALWNATERRCAWYMMGADGLRRKIERSLNNEKVGYAELFSRFGSRYQKISPDGKEAFDAFTKAQTALVARANGIEDHFQQIYAKTGGSLRRIYIEIQKLKQTG